MSATNKMLAGVSAVCLAGSGLLITAGAASAENPPFKQVSAPKKVVSGQLFTVKCQVDSDWAGWTAKIKQKGAVVNAKRTIGSGGNCTMRLELGPTGMQQIRVRVIGGNNAASSQWMKVRVLPS